MKVGCETWFKNRAVGLNAGWFKLTTLHHYRGQPRTHGQNMAVAEVAVTEEDLALLGV